jgi:trigger factor
LKVTTENTNTREVTLTIEPDPERMAKAKRRAASTLSRYRPVPGFRPGRAPVPMVERIFGADTVLQEAVHNVAEELFREAIAETDLRPLRAGEMEVESSDPIRLKVTVALVPTVELGDYRSLRIQPEAEQPVPESRMEAEIEALREQAAYYVPVERPIMATDQVVLQLKATEDDEVLLEDDAYEMIVSPQNEPYPFVDKLLAMRAGESAEVDAEFPEEHPRKELAGKYVHLAFTVQGVREKTLPEPNDDLAKDVSEYETFEELRQAIHDHIHEEQETARKQRETDAALKAFVEHATIEYPTAAVDQEVDAMIENEQRRVQGYGWDWATYLRITRKTEEQLRAESRPRAEERLVRALALSEFALREGLQVEPEEIDAEVERFFAEQGDRFSDPEMREALEPAVRRSAENDVLSRKTVEHLVAAITGREPFLAAAPEEEAEAPEEAAEGEEPVAEGEESVAEGETPTTEGETPAEGDENPQA